MKILRIKSLNYNQIYSENILTIGHPEPAEGFNASINLLARSKSFK
jgi:hypothetical protein